MQNLSGGSPNVRLGLEPSHLGTYRAKPSHLVPVLGSTYLQDAYAGLVTDRGKSLSLGEPPIRSCFAAALPNISLAAVKIINVASCARRVFINQYIYGRQVLIERDLLGTEYLSR